MAAATGQNALVSAGRSDEIIKAAANHVGDDSRGFGRVYRCRGDSGRNGCAGDGHAHDSYSLDRCHDYDRDDDHIAAGSGSSCRAET